MKPLFITGIDTGVGKTLVSAMLVEKLKADYWKPIQSGDLHHTDSECVKRLISNATSKIFPEAYRLSQPFSPHKAAALDGIEIQLSRLVLPPSNCLIIEGAGGLMAPLNVKDLMIDLILKFGADVVLVSKNYIGSINHTLLSIEALNARNIFIKGIIFNGKPDAYSEELILYRTGIALMGKIPDLPKVNQKKIKEISDNIWLNA